MDTIPPAPVGAPIAIADTRRFAISVRKHHLLLALLTLFVIAYLIQQVSSLLSPVPRALSSVAAALTPSPKVVEVDRLAMVRALQQKFEAITFSMRLEKAIPAGSYRPEDNAWQRQWEYGRTDIVPAKVDAGYVLGGFSPSQITATHEAITVDLGPPKILNVVIDHAHVKNVSEYAGFFVGWPDVTLQSQILTNAEAAFRTDACTNGILKAAADSAEKQVGIFLRTFLRAAGDKRAVVITSTAPTC